MHEVQGVSGASSPSTRPKQFWRRAGIDSLVAAGGVAVATTVISVTSLYQHIPTIAFMYLLVVLGVASWRGLYAAILASLLACGAYIYFLVPPLYTFLVPRVQDVLALAVFLTTAIITGQLASALRWRAEQAQSRERELRVLYAQAQELAALQERQRLARELHDSVSQVLYGISLGAHTAREALASEPAQMSAEVSAALDYVDTLAEAGLAEMRALIFELRPESLEREGLVSALSKQVAILRARHKLTVDVDLADEPELALETKYALYRVAQEALHNIVKHARAHHVVLRLAQRGRETTLEVQDDGRGFDATQAFPGHLGLHSMQERMAKLGGALTIESASDQGTCIRARIPLPAEGAG